MKKLLLLMSIVALTLTSCVSSHKTATQQNICGPIMTASYADLDVSSQKISYTFYPTKEINRGGYDNCVNAAISEALKVNGNGDVLVETQKAVVKKKRVLFRKKIISVTVTGYPAKYKNFRSADTQTLKELLLQAPAKGDMNCGKKKHCK